MKLLAIDFGLKHLGLAFSEGEIAEPLKEIKVDQIAIAIKEIVSFCKQHQIEKIIIGLPEGNLVQTIKDFAHQLNLKTNLPVIFHDETLTSKEAAQKMVEAGLPLKKRQKSDHLFSACLILQSYLDSEYK